VVSGERGLLLPFGLAVQARGRHAQPQRVVRVAEGAACQHPDAVPAQQQLGEIGGGLDTEPPQQHTALRGEVRVQVERAVRNGDGRARRGEQRRDRAGDRGVQPAGPRHPPGYLRRLAEG